MQPKQPNQRQPNIQGEPLDLDILLDFTTIDMADIETASEWFDSKVSPEWVGTLDKIPSDA